MILSPSILYATSHIMADYEARVAFVSSGAGVSVCRGSGMIIVRVTKYNCACMSDMLSCIDWDASLRSESILA